MNPSGRSPRAALLASSGRLSAIADLSWSNDAPTGICDGNGDRRMLKYFIAASTGLVIAALVSYAVLATMGNEFSSGDALPKFLSRSDPNTPNSKHEKTNPGKQGTNLPAQS